MKQKDIIMEAKSTTYDTLPERIDYLISEIREVKELLTQRIEKPEEIPKYLSLEQTLLYLEKKGFLVSKSKLYKMTSGDIIPCHKNGNRINFFPEELNDWLEKQFGTMGGTSQYLSDQKTINNIIKSAQTKKYYYGK